MPSPQLIQRPLPVSAQDRIDDICSRFEQAWQTTDSPPLEEFAACIEDAYRDTLLRELITIDIHSRRSRGNVLTVAEYSARFPAMQSHVERLLVAPGPQTPATTVLAEGNRAPEPEELPSLPGYMFSGRQLGEGGMGIVWRARDTQLHRDVAVKVLRSTLVGEPTIVRRFQDEAQLTSQLQHPGIPPVHAMGILDDGRPYFCMKIVKGHTLQQLLHDRTTPTQELPHLLQVFEQVCQAVAYAHSKAVVHRDLKPANVMVGAFGEVQVMDWGLGKVLEAESQRPPAVSESTASIVSVVETDRADTPVDVTHMGSVLGTYAYMPPEQALGLTPQVDRRSDVFGLGAMLCEILTGHPPYEGSTAEVKARAQLCDLSSARPRLRECEVDEALVALAERCLSKDRDDRPAEGSIVAAAITSYQAATQERLRQAEIDRATAQAESRRAAAEAREEQLWATARSERRARLLGWSLAAALALGLVGTSSFYLLERQTAVRAESARSEADERRQMAEGLKRDLERLTYAHQIGLAQAEWDANNTRNAWTHLESTDPRFREWEYRYLNHLFTRNQITLVDKNIQIRSVDFRPDGAYLAATGGGNTVKIWDLRTHRVHKVLPHSMELNSVAFSPDGKLLACGGGETVPGASSGESTTRGEVKIWSADTFDVVASIRLDGDEVMCVAFNTQTTQLAAATGHWGDASPGTIRTWSTSNWHEICRLRGHHKWITSVAFGPDDVLASSSADGTLWLWDVDQGRQLGAALRAVTMTNAPTVSGFGSMHLIRNVAISPDGKRLAAAHWDGTARIWDRVSGELVFTLQGHTNCVHNVTFSADGKSLATASWDGTARLWDVETGRQQATLKGHRNWVLGVRFSPDGNWLATGCRDATVKLWDLRRLDDAPVLAGHTQEVTGLS